MKSTDGSTTVQYNCSHRTDISSREGNCVLSACAVYQFALLVVYYLCSEGRDAEGEEKRDDRE